MELVGRLVVIPTSIILFMNMFLGSSFLGKYRIPVFVVLSLMMIFVAFRDYGGLRKTFISTMHYYEERIECDESDSMSLFELKFYDFYMQYMGSFCSKKKHDDESVESYGSEEEYQKSVLAAQLEARESTFRNPTFDFGNPAFKMQSMKGVQQDTQDPVEPPSDGVTSESTKLNSMERTDNASDIELVVYRASKRSSLYKSNDSSENAEVFMEPKRMNSEQNSRESNSSLSDINPIMSDRPMSAGIAHMSRALNRPRPPPPPARGGRGGRGDMRPKPTPPPLVVTAEARSSAEEKSMNQVMKSDKPPVSDIDIKSSTSNSSSARDDAIIYANPMLTRRKKG